MEYSYQTPEPMTFGQFAGALEDDPAFQQFVAQWNAGNQQATPSNPVPQTPAEFQGLGKYASAQEFLRANPAGYAQANPGLPVPAADSIPNGLRAAIESMKAPTFTSERLFGGQGPYGPARIDDQATNANRLAAEKMLYQLTQQQQQQQYARDLANRKLDVQSQIATGRIKSPQQIEAEAFAKASGTFRAKEEAGVTGQKAPAGQRFTPDGNLEWIPGSPGEIKAKAAAMKAGEGLATHEAGTDALIRNIDQLIGDPEKGVAEHKGLRGSVGYLDAKLPPMSRDQATAQALIKGLLSKSAISGLQQIRQSGTAPGSITEKEWPLFQNLIATLDPTQDEATFTEQLKELRRVAMESKARARAGYETSFGSPRQPSAPGAAPAAPAPGPQYLEIRTTADGRKIGKKADGSFELVK